MHTVLPSAQREGGRNDGLVTTLKTGSETDQVAATPFEGEEKPSRIGGVKPLSFAYFSLRRQRKVGAVPHRDEVKKDKKQNRKTEKTEQGKQKKTKNQNRENQNR